MRKITKFVIIGLTLGIILSLVTTPVNSITDGELDGNAHPYVGLMVADVAGTPTWRCSGTLLSPTVFLTAGHCTYGADSVTIWFESDVGAGYPANGYPYGGSTSVDGTPYTHPMFDDNAFYLYDLGVVILDEPVYMDEYGTLPQLNVLESMATQRGLQDVTFTAVGYGLQYVNPVMIQGLLIRMVATPHLIMIDVPGFTGDFSILLSNNHATGGTCSGDSGGPNFIGDSNVIGGVTSYGINGNCAGTGGVYRVDTADDLNWLANFI